MQFHLQQTQAAGHITRRAALDIASSAVMDNFGEVPALLALPPTEAATIIAADTALFSHIEAGDLEAILLEGRLTEEEIDGVLERRTVAITTPTGKEIEIPVAMDPERALAFFRTIASSDDEEWKRRVLDDMDPNFLAYVICCQFNETVEIEEAEWMGLVDGVIAFVDHDAARKAARRERFDADEFERRLIDAHIDVLRELFTLPPDTVAQVKGSADDVLDELVGG